MQPDPQPWTFIAASDYVVPLPPVSDAARGKALRAWTALKRVLGRKESDATRGGAEWHRLPPQLLDSLTPIPDWTRAAKSYAIELGDSWFESEQADHHVRVLIGPPGCDVAALLRELARQRSAKLLEAPPLDSLLASEASPTCLPEIEETDEAIVVIPNLEDWYVRHEQGLSTVRKLLESVTLSRRRTLIGCDSWAWEFLKHAVAIGQWCGIPQTVAPFDARRLDAFFRSALDLEKFEFLQGGDDQLAFPEKSGPGGEAPQHQPSFLLKSLAAHARGNLAVALQFWRELLRLPDHVPADRETNPSDLRTISVLSCFEDVRPRFPAGFGARHRLVLHAILLHGGLPRTMLDRLLPLHQCDAQSCAQALLEAGILEERQGKISVTFTAYSAVRQDLHNEGFLTDTI